MKIVTGYRGEPHITSEQDRAKNQGIFGEGSYVLNVGTKLRAELESGNEIRIHDGVISHQGCVAVIEKGAYDALILANGTQGRQRIDLIVARYEKDVETEQESMDLVVIEGTPVTSDPVVPSYNEGDIQAGDILVDMPLYTVLLDGVQVSTITSVHEDLLSNEDLADTKVAVYQQLPRTFHFDHSDIPDCTFSGFTFHQCTEIFLIRVDLPGNLLKVDRSVRIVQKDTARLPDLGIPLRDAES